MFEDVVGAENVREVDRVWSVAPVNAAECGAAVRLCGESGMVVVPTGGGTKLDWGNPVRADVMLETRRMAGVYAHSPGDLTAVVGAGTAWAAMQAVLAEHRQMVALDPLWPERATVGGVVAVNDSGALRARYGSLRDLVIGMTVVLADGTEATSGGRVVKNVAGYDLHKLMIGAYGTLGVVTEVVFRLHPVADTGETGNGKGNRRSPAGITKGTDGAREAVFEGAGTVLKVSLPESRTAEWVSRLPGGVKAVAYGGLVTVGVPAGGEVDVTATRLDVEAMGGSVVVLRGGEGLERWGAEPAGMEMMREVKRRFDPKRVLNSGRFVGGI